MDGSPGGCELRDGRFSRALDVFELLLAVLREAFAAVGASVGLVDFPCEVLLVHVEVLHLVLQVAGAGLADALRRQGFVQSFGLGVELCLQAQQVALHASRTQPHTDRRTQRCGHFFIQSMMGVKHERMNE